MTEAPLKRYTNNIDHVSAVMAMAEQAIDQREPLASQQGAFVIRFRARVDVEQGRFTGRAEHVASGEMARFATPDELVAFVRNVLSGVATSTR